MKYDLAERERILCEVRRTPTCEQAGTASWSLSTLQRSLQTAEDGLPMVSEFTIRKGLLEAGYDWQRSRSWCQTGQVVRIRKAGSVGVTDPDGEAKKLIEQAYRLAELMGLSVWCEDEAGPYQTQPYPGAGWQIEGHPLQQSHEYSRNGTAKVLTRFHPADGQLYVKGVTSTTNSVVHAWLKQTLSGILADLLPAVPRPAYLEHLLWETWRTGLQQPISPRHLPPLRLLLILDNLVGHKNPDWLNWCFRQGILPVYIPLGAVG